MSDPAVNQIWRWEENPGDIRTLWFDQPGRAHNTLNHAVFDELQTRLAEIDADRSVSGLVIRSAKPQGFCMGIDLDSFLELGTEAEVAAFARHGLAAIDHLSALKVPTLAVIHGACFGGGLELALACNRRVAFASAAPLQLGMPEVDFGLIPVWGGIARIPRIVGPDEGLNLLISGRTIGYLLARSLGIVDRLASDGDSIESMKLVPSGAETERTWPTEAWDDAWNHAREAIDRRPGDHPEAQLQILTIASIDLAHGSDVAREAAVQAFAELATSDIVRDQLTTARERPSNLHDSVSSRD